ncbi:unnamed protein product [Lactuca saligna]|uniref:Uncharacterized protein n=1 Tax=Lactuca saligna TaxID=75948 RepID=A0AA36A2T5_LACSI|nr:unnamed protein product [Lactuca saligna]
MSKVSIFHTTGIIVADSSKFAFIDSIPEAKLRDVPPASKVLKGYYTFPASDFRTLTPEMQSIIDEADKPKKGGNKGGNKGRKEKEDMEVAPKKRELKRAARKTKSPTPSESEHSQSDTQSNVRNEEEQPICNEEEEQVHNEEATSHAEVTPTYNDFFPSPPSSPEHTTTPITIAPCPPHISSEHQSIIP